MLITALCLTLTAVLAGLTGTWSPCGLSSVDTLGSGLGRAPRAGRTLVTVGAFTVLAVVGGAVTFGGAAAAGSAAGLGGHAWAAASAAVLALVAGVGDLRFLAIRPQIRRQVPEAVRWRVPLPITAAAYGLLLGLGFTTYLLTYAMWALLGACVLLGDPVLGVVVGATFGLGRALPVAVLVPRFGRPETSQFIAEMERGPSLVGLRRIDGVALLVCALAVVPVATAGAAGRVIVRSGTDPSVDAGTLAYETSSGTAYLARPAGPPAALPGQDPALGAGFVAWHVGDAVTVADTATLTPVLTVGLAGVTDLAVTLGTLFYLREDAEGRQAIGSLPVDGSNPPAVDFRAPRGAHLGRLSASRSVVVFAETTARGSRVVAVDRSTGRARTLRQAGLGTQITQAAIHGRHIVYVRTSRCSQELRYGTTSRSSRDRVLVRLRPLAEQDGGYQRGYPNAYNAASKCPPGRRFAAVRGRLWTTALSAAGAFVTRLPLSGRSAPVILRAPVSG